MKSALISHAHSVTCEQQSVTKQSTPHNCNYGLPQPFQGFAVTFPRHCPVSQHGVNSLRQSTNALWTATTPAGSRSDGKRHCPVSGHGVNSLRQSINAKRGCSYTLYPTPVIAGLTRNLECTSTFIILALLLFLSPLAHSAVWDGTADTAWYTNNKSNTTFTITTAEQLAGLARLVNGTSGNGTYNMSGKTITLGANIELNDTTANSGWQNWGTSSVGLSQWTPIGIVTQMDTDGKTDGKPFSGTFDGAGHTISGLYISTRWSYQGLFGYTDEAVIKNVGVIAGYVEGGWSTGFLAGMNQGTISNSYATGSVSGSSYVGGLAGENYGTISNSYATGSVSGSSSVGGLAGQNGGTISNSYAAGSVSGTGSNVGGLAGYNGGTISNSYYDRETSGRSDEGKGTPKTTAQMQSQEMVNTLNLGAGIERNNAWTHNSGKYPTLSNSIAPELVIANYFESGNGNQDSPYIIKTKEHLENLAILTNAGHSFQGEYISLDSNIALNDTTGWNSWNSETNNLNQWTPISSFSGTFDGAGFAIRGLYINTENSNQGLYGYVNGGATIKNVGVIAGYVKGGVCVGFLAGYNRGTISNSYATGNVSGTGSDVGGLVGDNYSSGIISNSYATGAVSGTGSYVGGLAGWNLGTISNSYAAGNVSGTGSYVGGLAGYNYNGTISNSYYDSQTSGRSDEGKGTPKTTEEMQSQEMADILNLVASIERNNAWTHNSGKYPTLSNSIAPELVIASYFASGNGTSGNPYIIETKEQLENLATLTNVGHSFKGEYISLGSDIELNDITGWDSWNDETKELSQWTPIGTSASGFKGTFDGTGHTIRGLYISTGSSHQGLFGADSGAVIKNVGVIAGYVKGGSYTGFLAGYHYSGTISNSYATGNVSGTGDYVGGLAGMNRGTISNSYAAGSVSGTGDYVGGLAGYNNWDGTISNSYYDSETSGRSDNDGRGIPKTTEQMQSERFADLLNITSATLGTNAWTYESGKYPTLSNSIAPEPNIASYFASGNGTYGNPYIIETKAHLENLAFLTNAGHSFQSEYISLGNNIELNDTDGWVSWNDETSKEQWTPIGTSSSSFKGTFDGAGFAIRGLYISTSSSYQGLFGYIGSGAVIKNVGVIAGYVKGGQYTGFLVGYNYNGTISNSYATGNVSGSSSVGGLAGQNGGTISNSYATGNVSGTGSNVGGLAGYNYRGTISNSYATGSVSGTGSNVGGLAGENYGTISNSYATGSVSGTGSNVGGLAGYNNWDCTISNSYAAGNVSGSSYYVGGLAGRNESGTISNSYYDTQTSGRSDEGKGIPKTTEQMQSQEMVDLLNLGASVEGNNAWIYNSGKYPTLGNEKAQSNITIGSYFESGNGTSGNPYIIKTKEHLENLAILTNAGYSFQSEYISLGNDIELNDTTLNEGWQNWGTSSVGLSHWTPIGIGTLDDTDGKSFSGTFDGAGYTISGLYVNPSITHQGLFGCIGSGAVIKNVGVIAGYVTGSSNVGFLAGWNKGTISNSYATGNVSGYWDAGGLAGLNGGTISNSYATGNVSGQGESVGGLAGRNYGTISNSYACGDVSGTADYVGGLAGYNNYYGTISNSYACGDVSGTADYVGGLAGVNDGTISNSYYDSQTSGQNDEGKGIPKTTAQMQSQEMADSLNFEASKARNNAWIYNEGGKYPTLSNSIAPKLDISGYFASGDGTLSNPYIITTKEHLENLAALTNAGFTLLYEYISLGQDIALNDTTLNEGWQNWGTSSTGLSQWTPIGTEAKQFSGTFDGAGHTISGLYINTENSYQGLFGFVNKGAVIKNVGVIAGYVKGGQEYTGFLVGYNYEGTISNSYATGNVSGDYGVGGLAGYNYSGTISNSYATGNVSGDYGVGGLAGRNESGTISNSYYDMETSGQGGYGTPKTTAEMQSQLMVAMLNVVASTERYNAWIYENGKYPALSGEIAPEPIIANYFASGNGTSESPYIIETKAHLENLAILTNRGHSFQSEYISLGNNIALNDTTLSGGWQNWDNNTSGLEQWTPIGTDGKPFSGTFDGAGHTISGLYISTSSDYQGLFGYDSAAVIKNVGVIAGYVKGGSDVGFLVGMNWDGTISNSYATGNVSGDYWDAGGLAGGNYGIIGNSYATGNVSGYWDAGGLVGSNWGTISNSYATGNVSGQGESVGGLAGENWGIIINSYATGNVSGYWAGGLAGSNSGTIINSYYDSQTSGQSDEGKGTPKTTAQMKQLITFEDWDFPGIWFIDEGNDYPKLLWSIPDFGGVSVNTSGWAYTGDSIKPAITISGLTQGTHFKVSYFNNVNAGDAWAVVFGIDGTVGKKVIDFTISPKALASDAIQAISDQTFTGSAITPNIAVQDNTKVLTKDVDYALEFSGNVAVGKATVTASGKGNYTGTASADFNIIPEFSSSSSEPESSSSSSSSVIDDPQSSSSSSSSVIAGDDPQSSSSETPSSSSSGGEVPIIADGTFSGNFDLQVKNGMLWIATGSLPRATTRGNDVTVQLYNLNGAKVRSFSFASGGAYSVSLKDLPKGMYIVKAVFGSERKVQRVMN